MRIGVDIRCLLEPHPSGVAYYTNNLLHHLFQLDKDNQYFLFYNSFRKENTDLMNVFKKYSNVHLKGFNYPNKIFNFFINFLHYPKIDKLLGGVDVFFAPNLQFISLSAQCKKIVTVHDLSFDLYPEFLSLKRKLWHEFINPKRFTKKADKIIAVSHNTKKDIVNEYKIDEQKIHVIHSGISESVNVAHESKTFEKITDKYILTISTLEPRKNIESLIDAFNLLSKEIEYKDYFLFIAGASGWKAKNIYKKARHNKKIKFLGFIDDQQKKQLYKNAEVFVYPSFYEGFGFPPLEALAQGTPVIVSINSSLPEILDNAALYINPYDINDIVTSLKTILSHQELKQEFIEKGKKQIQKFNWQTTAQETLNILQELV